MGLWTILWAAVWLLPNGQVDNALVGMAAPTFESQDACEAYLLKYKTPLTFALAQHLKLPVDARLIAEGECQLAGQPA